MALGSDSHSQFAECCSIGQVDAWFPRCKSEVAFEVLHMGNCTAKVVCKLRHAGAVQHVLRELISVDVNVHWSSTAAFSLSVLA